MTRTSELSDTDAIDKVRPSEVKKIPLSLISDAKGLQCRVDGLRNGHVAQLVVALDYGWAIGPIKTVWDGFEFHVYDGWHRIEAHRRLNREEIDAEVIEGTRDEAILLSASANKEHGLKRNRADRRRAIMIALEHPLCQGWSDQRVANFVGVSRETINDYRPHTISEDSPRVGVNGRLYHGKKRTSLESVSPSTKSTNWTWPAWLKAPFIAMDKDGHWTAFSKVPKVNRASGFWQTEGEEAELHDLLFAFDPPASEDWSSSLRMNPN